MLISYFFLFRKVTDQEKDEQKYSLWDISFEKIEKDINPFKGKSHQREFKSLYQV